MQQRVYRPVIAGTAIAIVAGILILLIARSIDRLYTDVSVSAPLVALSTVAYSEGEVRDRDIEFYTRRAQEDGRSALDRLTLATLLFNRARASGSNDDLARAESLARESASMREARNGQALSLLATILMTRHAFREAHDVAQRADSLEPGTPPHLALLGEIELELGDYAAAEKHFRQVHFDGHNFTIGARLSRWYEVTGRGDNARGILEKAITKVDERDDLPVPLPAGRAASAPRSLRSCRQRLCAWPQA
jgi:tetratricopeptide (TPR) repeat protein